jgi:hypothetical protein
MSTLSVRRLARVGVLGGAGLELVAAGTELLRPHAGV